MSGIIDRKLLNDKLRLQYNVKNRLKYKKIMDTKIKNLSSQRNIYQSGMTKEDRKILGVELSKEIYKKTIDLFSEEDNSITSLFSNDKELEENVFLKNYNENVLQNEITKKRNEEKIKKKQKLKRKPIFESEKASFYFFENRIKKNKIGDIFQSLLFLDKKEMIEKQSNPIELYRYVRKKYSRTDILSVVNKI